MYRISPLRALVGGLVAGAAGSFIQNLFFKATTRFMPGQPENVFSPPEPQQREETPMTTVGRRVVEGMLARELPAERKARAGTIVHYAFGSLWGGVYGIVGESIPFVRSPVGMVAFSAAVWGVSDNLLLPAFKLSAWPTAYPARNHAYALAAHVAYGAGVWGTYEVVQRVPWATAIQLILLRRSIDRATATLGSKLREPIAAIAPLLRKPISRVISQVRA